MSGIIQSQLSAMRSSPLPVQRSLRQEAFHYTDIGAGRHDRRTATEQKSTRLYKLKPYRLDFWNVEITSA